MNNSRTDFKVGLFVLMGLVLLGVLLLNFNKGMSWLHPTYELLLNTRSVGSIKAGSGVLMSGVPVGSVTESVLAQDGRSVNVHLKIYQEYEIKTNAVFTIEQAGFLGDQFVGVTPATNNIIQSWKNGDTVVCTEPFNLLEFARDAGETLVYVKQIVTNLNAAFAKVDRTVLSEKVLLSLTANLTNTMINAQLMTSNANIAMQASRDFLQANTQQLSRVIADVSVTLTNVRQFSTSLAELSIASTNARVLTENFLQTATNLNNLVVTNIATATVQITNLLSDVQAGKGLAGAMFVNDGLKEDTTELIKSLRIVGTNLAQTSERLNKHGIWGIMWKQKPESTPATNKVQKVYHPVLRTKS